MGFPDTGRAFLQEANTSFKPQLKSCLTDLRRERCPRHQRSVQFASMVEIHEIGSSLRPTCFHYHHQHLAASKIEGTISSPPLGVKRGAIKAKLTFTPNDQKYKKTLAGISSTGSCMNFSPRCNRSQKNGNSTVGQPKSPSTSTSLPAIGEDVNQLKRGNDGVESPEHCSCSPRHTSSVLPPCSRHTSSVLPPCSRHTSSVLPPLSAEAQQVLMLCYEEQELAASRKQS